MDDRRHQLFARPGLPVNQHGGVGSGDATDDLVDILHRRTVADERLLPVAFGQQTNDPVAQVLAFEEALDSEVTSSSSNGLAI